MTSTLLLRGLGRTTKMPFPSYVAQYLKDSPDFLDGIGRGVAAYREGKFRPWEDIKRELGIGACLPD